MGSEAEARDRSAEWPSHACLCVCICLGLCGMKTLLLHVKLRQQRGARPRPRPWDRVTSLPSAYGSKLSNHSAIFSLGKLGCDIKGFHFPNLALRQGPVLFPPRPPSSKRIISGPIK